MFTRPALTRPLLAGALVVATLVGATACSTHAASEADLRSFARCITKSGARFYGAHWCGFCVRQKKMFGAAADALPYIECYEPGTRNKLSKCASVTGFPRWVWPDGSEAPGLQSFEALAKATGCSAPD